MSLAGTVRDFLNNGRRNRTQIASHARQIVELLQISRESRGPASSFPEDVGSAESNIAFNRARWGDKQAWLDRDKYGYRWAGSVQQNNFATTPLANRWLLPHVGDRYALKVMELAPGAGRFTAELVRISRELHLVDLNEACIELCKERFKYYPKVYYYVNDGLTCDVVDEEDFDLIASFDSMVHMTPDVIESYVLGFSSKLKPGGICWLDHSGKGFKEIGHRTAMTDEMMIRFAEESGLTVVAQYFRNDHDCISVLQKPE